MLRDPRLWKQFTSVNIFPNGLSLTTPYIIGYVFGAEEPHVSLKLPVNDRQRPSSSVYCKVPTISREGWVGTCQKPGASKAFMR